jgi:hypothetical protein
MAPSSGCSIASAHDLLQAVSASDVVMGIGCVDDQAAMTTGSILTQDGGADGAIWTAQLRSADTWTITDVGTGIDTTLSFPILPAAMWPTSTTGRSSSYWAEPIEAIPSQTTVDAFADELLAALGPLSPDPEFPMNERLVEVRPGGLPLVIVQVDVGGDDSVVGAVFYVWLDEIFDEAGPTGWRAGEVLVGDVCGRGDSSGDICP